MFEKELKRRLEQIFGIPKVSFDLPGESLEQGVLFIDVSDARSCVKHERETAKVTGSIVIYSQADRLPFGFFSKKINQASAELTQGLFFFNMDENTKTQVNLVERRCGFVFLYSGEYDPDNGELTSVEFEGVS